MKALSSHERIARAMRIGPLFDYMRDHGIRISFVREGLGMQRTRIYQIANGSAPTPPHFIEDACRILRVDIKAIYPDWPTVHIQLPPITAETHAA